MKAALIKSLALLCPFAATASAAVVIKDFQGSGTFDFDYLSWTGQITNTATGIEVGGTATTFGGAGGGATFDLTGNTDLVVSAKLLAGNAATAFNVVLQSASGSSAYQFSTSTLNSGYQSLRTSLATPFFTTGGGANLAAITDYQIQGNFVGPVALGLGFANVSAVSARILEDFQGPFAGYTYGSWDGVGQTTPGPDFFTVGGTATEAGGLGNGYPTTDISSYQTNGQVTLEVRLKAGNLADSFNVLLQSADTFNNRYNFSTSGLNTTDFVTVSMALDSASGTNGGGLDWAALNTYQLQGDFGPAGAFQMEFRNLAIDATPFDVANSIVRTNSNLISGGGGVSKTGTGTLILTGANTYTGATTITGGTLVVNGSTAGGSAVSVASAGTLGGTGTIGGTLALTGVLAPGDAGVVDIETLNAGTTTWNGGSIWNFDLSSTNSTSDQLAITGNLVKGTGTLGTDYVFNFMGSQPVWNTTYTLATFASFTGGFTNGLNFTATNLGAGSYSTSYFTLNGTSLTFTAVPEPTSALAGLLLGAGLLRRRRTGQGRVSDASGA